MITLERYNYSGSATNDNACILDSDNRTVTFNIQNNTTDRFAIIIYLTKTLIPFVFEFEVLSVSNSSSCIERILMEGFGKNYNNGNKPINLQEYIDINFIGSYIEEGDNIGRRSTGISQNVSLGTRAVGLDPINGKLYWFRNGTKVLDWDLASETADFLRKSDYINAIHYNPYSVSKHEVKFNFGELGLVYDYPGLTPLGLVPDYKDKYNQRLILY